jgi:formate-dependent nitrite reductase membrane component NrfD
MLVAGLLIYSLYSEKKKCRKYFASSFTATGVSCVLIGLISLIARVGKGASITPVVYQNAIYHAITVMFVVVIFIGIVFTAISVILSLRINHLTKSTKNR